MKLAQGKWNPKKPNILLVMADDHRGESIGALGASPLQTPTMDRLINEGSCFVRNWQTCSYNVAVCVPTRAAMHTGTCVYEASRQKDLRDAPQPGIYTINPKRKTLGQVLGEQGYHTFLVAI
jgi:arylsulfatase A-like enzyme